MQSQSWTRTAQVGVVYGDAQCFGTRTDHWRVGPFDADKLLNWNFIHASALYRRSVWEQNGGYDLHNSVQGLEDWDFWLGAMEHGWRFAYMPEVFFEYRRADQSLITSTAGFEDQVREFVARKHGLLYRQAWLSLVSERAIPEMDLPESRQIAQVSAEAEIQQRHWSPCECEQRTCQPLA